MKQLIKLLKNNSRLVWPYDLSLLKVLGVLVLVIALCLELRLSLVTPEAMKGVKVSSTYLSLFSERNAMIEFDRELGDYYSFPKVKGPFGTVDIAQSKRFTKGEFEALILASIPQELRYKLSYYLPFAIDTAQKYQVDPFWVLAVMWTESHFEHLSISPNMAYGLMQIVPETGHFISQKVLKKGVTYKDAKHFIKEPYVNIELGTIYLKSLLERFHNNYLLATVAYNLGPSRVLGRLNQGKNVGGRNDYLNKVKKSYEKLTQHYKVAVANVNSPVYKSYVVSDRSLHSEGSFAMFVPVDFKQSVTKGKRRVSYNKNPSPFMGLVY